MASSTGRHIQQDTALAETTHGRLAGAKYGGLVSFRGVRYGQSTAGANRFRPPQPPANWTGVRDALEWAPSAPQKVPAAYSEAFYSWYSTIREISEDCLFLNIFTPAIDDHRRPVMIWLHGGGWRNFAATAPGTDGSRLAMAENVVVVTLNHRLGALGFFSIGQDDERFADAGNVGLLDIVMAMEWVRDNIAAFGGDPGNVTIFGQSGGAAKVAALMAMTAARGLFHKAIVQSSSGGLQIADLEEAEKFAFAVVRKLGLESPEGGALQNVPLDKFMAAVEQCPWYFRPVVDYRNFSEDPFLPTAPALSSHVPLMAGCTNTETTYYMRRNRASFGMEIPEVKVRLARFLNFGDAATDQIVDAYREADPNACPSDVLIAVTTDYLFKRNTYRMAKARDSAYAPSFAFVFAFESPVENGILRSPHTLEIPFIFGTAEAACAMVGVGPDVQPMTKLMMATWAQFARSGDPNNPLLPNWRPYSASDRPIMALQLQSALLSNPGGKARAMLDELPFYEYGRSRDDFWSDRSTRLIS